VQKIIELLPQHFNSPCNSRPTATINRVKRWLPIVQINHSHIHHTHYSIHSQLSEIRLQVTQNAGAFHHLILIVDYYHWFSHSTVTLRPACATRASWLLCEIILLYLLPSLFRIVTECGGGRVGEGGGGVKSRNGDGKSCQYGRNHQWYYIAIEWNNFLLHQFLAQVSKRQKINFFHDYTVCILTLIILHFVLFYFMYNRSKVTLHQLFQTSVFFASPLSKIDLKYKNFLL
jgi:hypothetical protein